MWSTKHNSLFLINLKSIYPQPSEDTVYICGPAREVHMSIKYTTYGVARHYCGVIKGSRASQITSLTIVYSTVYSDADQRKHQSSTSLAFVRGIHRVPVNSPLKWPVTRETFPLMVSSWLSAEYNCGMDILSVRKALFADDYFKWRIRRVCDAEHWWLFRHLSSRVTGEMIRFHAHVTSSQVRIRT